MSNFHILMRGASEMLMGSLFALEDNPAARSELDLKRDLAGPFLAQHPVVTATRSLSGLVGGTFAD